MTTRLILHAGSHKTGTTAIQQALFQHRGSFAKAGILYDPGHRFFGGPKTAHHGLAHALARFEAADRAALARYRKMLDSRAQNADLVVISAEPFLRHIAAQSGAGDRAGQRLAYVARVAEYLQGFDVTVSIYLRRPDRFAVSLYKENLVRTGLSMPFADYLVAKADTFHYQSRLAPFRQHFTSVDVRSYEATVARGLVRGFFEDHGLPLSPDFQEDRTRGSISAAGAIWLARAKSGGNISERDRQRRWDFLLSPEAQEILADPAGTGLWASSEQRRSFVGAALAGFDLAGFWDSPQEPVQPVDWNDIRQAKTDAAYSDWLHRNAARLKAREALGAAPYQPDISLPSARFMLLRRYFGALGAISRD